MAQAAFNAIFERAFLDILTRFGEDVTYVPFVPPVAPFSCSAVVTAITLDQIQGPIVCDQCECSILHSVFVENGIDEPTASNNPDACDTIVIKNVNDIDQTWNVVAKTVEAGVWKLTIERDIRVLAR